MVGFFCIAIISIMVESGCFKFVVFKVDLEDNSIEGTDYTEDSEDSECLIIEGEPVQVS